MCSKIKRRRAKDSAATIRSMATTESLVMIGYVNFGKYYDEPILWKCVAEDTDRVTPVSEYILCAKLFDAAESGTVEQEAMPCRNMAATDGQTQTSGTAEQFVTNSQLHDAGSGEICSMGWA